MVCSHSTFQTLRRRTSTLTSTICVFASTLGGCIITAPPPSGDTESSGEPADDEDANQESSGGLESSSGEETSDSDDAESTTSWTTTSGSTTSGSTTTGSTTTGSTTSTTGSDSTTWTESGTTSTTSTDSDSSDTEGYVVPATFATVRQIFQARCGGAGCHAQEHAPTLVTQDPNDPNLYMVIMNHTAVHCGGIPFVAPGDPENSGFLRALNGECEMIGQMPLGCSDVAGTCIPQPYRDAVAEWIANGAPEQ